MKFALKSATNSGARRGLVSGFDRLPNVQIETPALLLYTKSGTVPHLTPDVLTLLNPQPDCVLLSVPSISTVHNRMKNTPMNINQFIGLSNLVSIVSLVDPGQPRLEGFHKKDIVSVQTRSGKVEYNAETYMDLIGALKPDVLVALCDGDTKKDSSGKRVEKSMARSEAMTARCVEIRNENDNLKTKGILVGLEGGLDVKSRRKYAETISQRLDGETIAGVVIDGLGQMGEEIANRAVEEYEEYITASLNNCTIGGVRLLLGPWQPRMLFRLIELGIDMFDASYPCMVTERGGALLFPSNWEEPPTKKGKPSVIEISLKDKENAELFEPISSTCKCHCCLNHTRAYIHHLINVNEMLATVLLNIHNHQQYLELFANIRLALDNNTFQQLKEWFG